MRCLLAESVRRASCVAQEPGTKRLFLLGIEVARKVTRIWNRMRFAGFFLMVAGFFLNVAALVLLQTMALRYLFVICGFAVVFVGFGIVQRSHTIAARASHR